MSNAERVMLHEHGTKAFDLPPSAIVATAASDLRLRERKSEDDSLATQPYAFHRAHVRKATTPAELIALALKEPGKAETSNKLNTKRIYGDAALLAAALEVATPTSTEEKAP